MANFIKWAVEIEVDESWVADGFDLTDERAHDMVTNDLRHAYGHEIRCKVIARPHDSVVAKLQGFRSVGEYRRARRRTEGGTQGEPGGLTVALPPGLVDAIEKYLGTDWSDGRDPSKIGALNAVAFIGEQLAGLLNARRSA